MRAATTLDETTALEKRYQDVLLRADSRGTRSACDAFEKFLDGSVAVIARPFKELQRLASSDNEIYATYYELQRGGIRIPEGDHWDRLRRYADTLLFAGYESEIRFAALSLSGDGLTNYGDCTIVLKTKLIAYRATVMEANSVILLQRLGLDLLTGISMPVGYRAPWSDRAKLGVAKIGDRVAGTMAFSDYQSLLVHEGTTTADDDFVEVHIYGDLTIRTVESVIFTASMATPDAIALVDKARLQLARWGVSTR